MFFCPPIIVADPQYLKDAEKIAVLFALPLSTTLPETGLFLYFDQQGLALCQTGQKAVVRVDFVSGSLGYRRQKGGGELIARAVNSKYNHHIWDFTAGLGCDAFILASLGAQITLFERHPAVAALLYDGLNRARQEPSLASIIERMQLVWVDVLATTDFSQYGTIQPEVVYLDPMYPEDKKTAAVKKEMAYFHQLVDQNKDAGLLLPLAQKFASKRIVVKRPRLGVHLNAQQPDYAYTGKSTRFDVYLPKTQQNGQ